MRINVTYQRRCTIMRARTARKGHAAHCDIPKLLLYPNSLFINNQQRNKKAFHLEIFKFFECVSFHTSVWFLLERFKTKQNNTTPNANDSFFYPQSK